MSQTANPATVGPTDRSRRRWQFTLRALFVLMTLTAVALAIFMCLYHLRVEQIAREQNREKAQLLVDFVLQKRHWDALEANEQFRQKVVTVLATKLGGPLKHVDSIHSPANLGPGGREPQNEFERALLARYAAAPQNSANESTPLYADRIEQGVYHYYQPMFADSGCIDCHRINDKNPALREGDLISILYVRLPEK